MKQAITDLVDRCAQETDRYFRGDNYDSQFCFEIFRRAILERDQLAWEAVYKQYQILVGKWVQQHQGFAASGEEIPYFVNSAFEKIWVALTPDKFRQFTQLASLLSYLKMCVHSVIVDHNRLLERASLCVYVEEAAFEKKVQAGIMEDRVLSQIDRRRFWDAINARLNDDKERRVVYGSFVLALKPRELYDHFCEHFDSVDEIYLIKQNILSRMRHDPEFFKYLSNMLEK
jgi:DNA-directed RNA polymerase specialized sigma24 family protein